MFIQLLPHLIFSQLEMLLSHTRQLTHPATKPAAPSISRLLVSLQITLVSLWKYSRTPKSFASSLSSATSFSLILPSVTEADSSLKPKYPLTITISLIPFYLSLLKIPQGCHVFWFNCHLFLKSLNSGFCLLYS